MKLGLALSGGLIATLGLFYLMANLVGTGKAPRKSSLENHAIDFVRIKRQSNTEARTRTLPKKPPPPKKAPPVPKTQIADQDDSKPAPDNLNIDMPPMELGLAGGTGPYLGRGGGGGAGGNRDETPLVRINPEYPTKALMRGIEGSVTVSFNISSSGRPINLEIENASPPRIFDRAVRRAVLRWKYKPRMKDGKPVDSPDRLSVVFPFTLTDEE